MGHRLRLAMQRGSMLKLRGEVEVDETFIGGSARFMHKAKRAAKIKGGTGVIAKVVPNIRKRTLEPEVRNTVERGAQVFSDASASYDDLGPDYVHQVIDHAETYVKGKI